MNSIAEQSVAISKWTARVFRHVLRNWAMFGRLVSADFDYQRPKVVTRSVVEWWGMGL